MKAVVTWTFLIMTAIATLCVTLLKCVQHDRVTAVMASEVMPPAQPQTREDITKLNDSVNFTQQQQTQQSLDLSSVHAALAQLQLEEAKNEVQIQAITESLAEVKSSIHESESAESSREWVMIITLIGIVFEAIWRHIGGSNRERGRGGD